MCTYTRNLKTTGCIWTFYTLKDCSIYYHRCLFSLLEPDLKTTGCICTFYTLKDCSIYYHRCLFSLLKPDVNGELWSKHASQSFSDKPFVRTYTKNVQHIERLLYCRRRSLCALELHERSNLRTMTSDTHWLFSDTTLCGYTASLYIHVHQYLVSSYASQQNSRT